VPQPIQVSATRFEHAAGHVDIPAREIIKATPNATEGYHGRCKTKLCQFPNKPGSLQAGFDVLVLLVLRLPMELLLQVGDE
jgi:hypothetical protein